MIDYQVIKMKMKWKEYKQKRKTISKSIYSSSNICRKITNLKRKLKTKKSVKKKRSMKK